MKKKVCIIIGIVLGLCLMFGFWKFLDRDKIKFKDDEVMAIINIGGIPDNYDYSVVEKYFKKTDYENIDIGGTERYFIIPRDDMNINLYKLSLGDDGTVKREFIKNMKESFYVTCNESELYSNVLLVFEGKDGTYEYSPYISLKDGRLVTTDFVRELK